MHDKSAAIIGWGHTAFGKLEDAVLEDLITDVATQALHTSQIEAKDIDAIYLGHFNAGMAPDGFASSLVQQAHPDLRFTPSTRCENACASGSAAVYGALDAIYSGRARIALVVGVEKMTDLDRTGVTKALGSAGYQNNAEEQAMSFPAVFAQYAKTYFERHGDQLDALAMIATKNHANALENIWAHLRKPLDMEFCNTVSEKNPIIADPLRMSDCSLVSDGAAAVVLASHDVAAGMDKVVSFRAHAHVSDLLPLGARDYVAFEGPHRAFEQAYGQAGVTWKDLDFAEVHDCFTIAELLTYEAMGITETGQGRRALDSGTVMKDGQLPINLSGGLKAKGHPVGATGVSMHALAYLQLTGQAGAMQKKDAALGAVFNMGGAGVANYVSILERVS